MAWQVASYGGGVPLGSTPDEYQGYGRVDLVNALPLERCPYSLFVHESSLRQLQEHRMVVRVSSAAVPLKVTASSPSSSSSSSSSVATIPVCPDLPCPAL